MNTRNALTIAIALTVGAIAPLASASAATPSSTSVTYADLNLSSKAGQAVLDSRIENAIEKVCGRTTGKIGFDMAVRKCQKTAKTNAVQARDLAVASYSQERLATADTKVIRIVAN